MPASTVVTLNGKSAKTVNGAPVKISVKGGKVYLNGSTPGHEDRHHGVERHHPRDQQGAAAAGHLGLDRRARRTGRGRPRPVPSLQPRLGSGGEEAARRAARRGRARAARSRARRRRRRSAPYVAASSQTVRSLISPTSTRALSPFVPGSSAIAARSALVPRRSASRSRPGSCAATARRGSLIVRLTIMLVVSCVFGTKIRRASSVTSVV